MQVQATDTSSQVMNESHPKMLPFRKLSGRMTSEYYPSDPSPSQSTTRKQFWKWTTESKQKTDINNSKAGVKSDKIWDNYEKGAAFTEQVIFTEWSWMTELHGMASLLSAKTRKGQTFWGMVILSCLTVGAFSANDLIGEYTESPTATLITMQQTKVLMFPKITVCPKIPDALQLNKIIASMNSTTMPLINNATAQNLIAFVIAGSGFDNFETLVNRWTLEDIELYEQLYDKWRGNMSVSEFFSNVMEQNDYVCEDFFPQDGCLISGIKMNCCEIFEPRYVMRRGRCFSSVKLFQTNVDEMGKIVLKLNHLPSRLVDLEGNGIQSEVIVYVAVQNQLPGHLHRHTRHPIADVNSADHIVDDDFIPDYPRYHINANEWNRMRFRARFIDEIQNEDCSAMNEFVPENGPNFCFVSNWLNETIIKPYNCTLPYLLGNIAQNKSVCHPALIVRNYGAVIHERSPFENVHECKPSCERWEFDVSIHMNGAKRLFKGNGYRLEASYMDLNYENYQEVLTTTFPGFVSQIGGQLSLFLGISIVTCVQFVIHICIRCCRFLIFKNRRSLKTNNPLFSLC